MPTQPPYQKAELLALQAKISQGHEPSLSSLLAIFSTRLIDFAFAIIHKRAVAEEIVEDIFIKLWLKRSNILSINNLDVYLYVSVKNACINEMAKKSMELTSQPIEFYENGLSAQDNPADKLVNNETMQLVQEVIERLPPRCKLIFKLVREDGLSYKTVAEILDISVNTIDNQMANAVRRISEAMHICKPKTYKVR